MKKRAILVAAILASSAAQAEDIAPALRGCSSFSSAADYIASTANSRSPHIVDGVSYFKPRPGIVYGGMDVLAVFAYGHGLKGASDDPAFGYGVVIEGTEEYAAWRIKGTRLYATSSSISLPGHQFVEIGCAK